MNIPILCIIQARFHSHRLPGKMLLRLNDETLIARAVRLAGEAFGAGNVIVAIPVEEGNEPLISELVRIDANWTDYPGNEWDVLDRFAHAISMMDVGYDTMVVRYTPDDHRKTVEGLRAVAAGDYSVPVQIGGEAMMASWFFHMNEIVSCSRSEARHAREHIGVMMPIRPAPPDDGFPWSIDTPEDLERARAILEGNHA